MAPKQNSHVTTTALDTSTSRAKAELESNVKYRSALNNLPLPVNGSTANPAPDPMSKRCPAEQPPPIEIPLKFADELRWRTDGLDIRTDKHIISALAQAPPVTSERNIWTFWHSGLAKMPSWCQRNVTGWVRRLGSKWTVRVLDDVPSSPNNVRNFVSSPNDLLPTALLEGTMSGAHSNIHRADIIRTALLVSHGGVWMDVGIVLFAHVDDICWRALEDPKSPYDICVPHGGNTMVSNFFIAARTGCAYVERMHDVYMELWKGGRTHCEGFHKHPLLRPVHELHKAAAAKAATRRQEGEKETTGGSTAFEGFSEAFACPEQDVQDYAAQILCFERICMLTGRSEDGSADASTRKGGLFDGRSHWLHKILLLEALPETSGQAAHVGWGGRAFYDALATPVGDNSAQAPINGAQDGADKIDIEALTSRRALASDLVWSLLARSSMLKIFRGPILLNPSLGTLWDCEDGADVAPGTFASVLRECSWRLEQRRDVRYVSPPEVPMTIDKGVLEE